jgi:hypothetical protein
LSIEVIDVKKAYYCVKPILPKRLQIFLRRIHINRILRSRTHLWPIDERKGSTPEEWQGWPGGKKFALVLTHDIDSKEGLAKSGNLMELDERCGFRSCFFVVPERYQIPVGVLEGIVRRGFELSIHGLTHDGKLYSSRKVFQEKAMKINKYLKDWQSLGFRSPAMHHNLEWLRDLDILYDASTFDTDPFEPQPDGVGEIFPFWVPGAGESRGYVELPYTLPQDFTLFVLMRESNIGLWQKKLDWIAERGGMALIISHPDYMNFQEEKIRYDQYPVNLYEEFLLFIRTRYEGDYWNALPREVAHFWVRTMVPDAKETFSS